MSTQTILDQSFPTPCKRCGGALYRQVDYCPYCGEAHPLDAGPPRRTAMPGIRASTTTKPAMPGGFDPAPSTESDLTVPATHGADTARTAPEIPLPVLVSPDAPIPPLPNPPHRENTTGLSVRKVLLGVVTLVAIGLAYVGYELFGSNQDTQNSNGDQTADTTQDARTTTGTIAPYTAPSPSLAQPVAHAPVQAQTQVQTQVPAQLPTQSPTVTAKTSTTPPAKPVNTTAAAQIAPVVPTVPVIATTPQVAAPVAIVAAKPAPALQFRDAAQAVQAARVAMRGNDLTTAQMALSAAQTLQPGNADALSLQSDLKPLTARRDLALQASQLCASQQLWPCARQHANETLTLDTGNPTAKAILERVIHETGWAPLATHAATASPQPAQPQQAQAQSQQQAQQQSQQQPQPSQQQAQLQVPLPKGMPADTSVPTIAPRPSAPAPDANSVEARERAIRESGWSHPSSNGTKPAAGTPPSQ